MRKLTYYVAISVDGFIARRDGGIADFAFEGEHVADMLRDYPETIPTHLREHFPVETELKNFDTVLMGRHTYDLGRQFGVDSPYQHLRQFVVSKSLSVADVPREVAVVAGGVKEFVADLKAEGGQGIWLCGGGVLAAALIDEIDELILKCNPFLMGQGIPLFAGEFPKIDLQVADHKLYPNGFALVKYRRSQRA